VDELRRASPSSVPLGTTLHAKHRRPQPISCRQADLFRELHEALPHDAICVDGVTPGGYRAIESLRLEKGYRAWGSDLTAETTPLEAGLGFAVKMDKGDFIGRDALREPADTLVSIVLEDPRAVALGSEPVRAGDEIVGRVTSGGYGYAVGASIVYAYVPVAHAAPHTQVAVDIFGDWVNGEVRAEPLYDPKGERVRA